MWGIERGVFSCRASQVSVGEDGALEKVTEALVDWAAEKEAWEVMDTAVKAMKGIEKSP